MTVIRQSIKSPSIVVGMVIALLSSPSHAADLPIITLEPKDVCAGESYIDVTGTTRIGTKSCAGPVACSRDGQAGCLTSTSYPAVSAVQATSTNIKTGVTIAGVAGALTPASGNCAADGSSLCVATPTHPAVDVSTFDAGTIKRGETVAGVLGMFPSSTYPLPRYMNDGATNAESGSDVPDLTNISSQMAVDTMFEVWDSAGVRYTGSGDGDLTANNIKIGIDVFGVVGDNAGLPPLPLWDVRQGVDRGDGQLGKLRVSCRNTAVSTVFNYDGGVGSLPDSGTTAGSAFDVWDSVNDAHATVGQPSASGMPGGWSDHYCGGLQVAADDDNVWQDVTTTPCNASTCRYKDKISGLQWSKVVASSRTWTQAVQDCDSYSHDGVSDWRLPTQKELHAAYVHGIRGVAHANWITSTDMNGNYFLTATGSAANTANAWYGYLGMGGTVNPQAKSALSGNVICVRP